jgi:hypothetical protein
MFSYKFIAAIILGVAMVSMVMSSGMNTCGTVEAAEPKNFAECTSDKNLTLGEKCCYIDAKVSNVTLSACLLLDNNTDISVIKTAAEALGENSTYSCGSSFVAVSTLMAFVFALLF